MKTSPPALVLLAAVLVAASFGACGTDNSDLSDQPPTAPTVPRTPSPQTLEQSSTIPKIFSTSTVGLMNWQTDPAFIPKQSYFTYITSVIDGDTIRAAVDGKQTSIRLIGIDTPESSTSTRPEECGGEEAAEFLRNILPKGTPILLTRGQELLDPYNRLLAYVHRQSDGLFINLAMAKYGMASELSFHPNTLHASHIRKAVTAARTAATGVWALCGTTDHEL